MFLSRKKIREGILIKEKYFFLYYLKSLKYFKIFILITFIFNAVNHIAKKNHFCYIETVALWIAIKQLFLSLIFYCFGNIIQLWQMNFYFSITIML
jgi:hypothetical protein